MLPVSTTAVLNTLSTPLLIASYEGEVLFANAAFAYIQGMSVPDHLRALLREPDGWPALRGAVQSGQDMRLRSAQCTAALAHWLPTLQRFRVDDASPWQFMVEFGAPRTRASLPALPAQPAQPVPEASGNRHQNLIVARMTGAAGNTPTLRDALTGVANRRALEARLRLAWHNAMVRGGTPISLLIAEIDHLERQHTAAGADAADATLRDVAAQFDGFGGRDQDLVARFGTEQFALLLPGADERGVQGLAERLHRRMRSAQLPHADSPLGAHVTLSVGTATMRPAAGNLPTALVGLAEDALGEARTAGQARSVFRGATGETR